jgi:hypothetical protein
MPVPPHQLVLRGVALEPLAKVVQILVELPCLKRGPCLRCPGSPRARHVPTQEFLQPRRFRRVVRELGVEVIGQGRVLLRVRYPGPEIRSDVFRHGWRREDRRLGHHQPGLGTGRRQHA